MKKSTFKRILSLVMALTMVMSYAVMPAAATEENTPDDSQQNNICTLERNCPATTHVEECLSQASCTCTVLCTEVKACPVCEAGGECAGQEQEQNDPVQCTANEDCKADTHDAACPYAPCTKTEGCQLVKDHEGDCTGMAPLSGETPEITDPEATVGETKYATLAEAVANAATGATVTLAKNVTLTDRIHIPSGKTIILNLNGKTVSQSKACTSSYEMISNDGNLTITGNGKLSFTDTGSGDPNFGWGSYTIRNAGTLVVENGTIEHLGAQAPSTHCIQAIFQYSGSTTINGGTISTPNYRAIRLWDGSITINGGTVNGRIWVQHQGGVGASLTINGGTFNPAHVDEYSIYVSNSNHTVALNIANGNFTGKIGAASIENLNKTVTGGTYTSDVSDLLDYGYSLNNGTVTANTEMEVSTAADLKKAIALSACTKIKLASDITLTETLTIPAGKTVTLDLNKNTISTTTNTDNGNHLYAIENKGTLTITGNGNINTRGINNEGTLTLQNGTINLLDGNGGWCNNKSGTFTMNGGKIITTGEDTDAPYEGYDSTPLQIDGGTVVLNDGEIVDTQNYTYAIIISGGTLNIPENSKIQIKGQHGAVALEGGTVTIQNGTFTCTGSNNGISDHALYLNKGTLTVSGGNFIGSGEKNTGDTAFWKETTGTCSVIGGTFNTDVSAMVAPGYQYDATSKTVIPVTITTTGTKPSVNDELTNSSNNVVKETVNSITNNEAVSNVQTGLNNVITSDDVDEAVELLEDQNKGTDLTGTTIRTTVSVELNTVTTENNEVKTLVFHVEPQVQALDSDGDVIASAEITDLKEKTVTFRLPMPDGTMGQYANVLHKHGENAPVPAGAYKILGTAEGNSSKNCYIELASGTFSEWTVQIMKSATTKAKINNTEYFTLKDALANAVSGNTIDLLGEIILGENGEDAAVALGSGITLNLNGNTLRGPVTGTLSMGGGTYYSTKTFKMVVPTASTSTDKAAYVSANGVFNISATGITIVSGNVSLDQSMGTQEDHTLVVNQGATFTVPKDMPLLIRKGSVTIKGTLINNEKITLESGASLKTESNGTITNNGLIELPTGTELKADVTGKFKMSGGTYYTTNMKMVAPVGTSDAPYVTDDAAFEIAADNSGITITSGTMGLGISSMGTDANHTLTIAQGAKFVIDDDQHLLLRGHAVVNGTLEIKGDGSVELLEDATLKVADDDLNVFTNVAGSKVVYENGTYKVAAREYVEVVKNGTTTKYYYGSEPDEYASFEAVLKETAPATYNLYRDETFNSAYLINSTYETIINLNGKKITGTGSITSRGKLTLNGHGAEDMDINLNAEDLVEFTSSGALDITTKEIDDFGYGSFELDEENDKNTTIYFLGTDATLTVETNGNISIVGQHISKLKTSAQDVEPDYKITRVDNGGQFVYGSSKKLKFESNGFYEGFDYVSIDGKELGDTKYEVAKGSTIVTLKNSYLKTLAKDKYTLTIHYKDGNTATANFSVVPAAKEASNPQTGDVILTSVVIMVVAAAALGVLVYMGKKKKK